MNAFERVTKNCGQTKATVALPVLLLVLLWAAAGPAETVLRIGARVPPVTIFGLAGEAVKIPESVRGKVVLLHFWQVGCSSCKLEMPAMDQLYGKYRRKGLEVLAVNIGQKKETVKTFAADLGVSYTILVDEAKKIALLYGVTDVPRTYILDRGGTVRYRIIGGAAPEMLKKLILSLL